MDAAAVLIATVKVRPRNGRRFPPEGTHDLVIGKFPASSAATSFRQRDPTATNGRSSRIFDPTRTSLLAEIKERAEIIAEGVPLLKVATSAKSCKSERARRPDSNVTEVIFPKSNPARRTPIGSGRRARNPPRPNILVTKARSSSRRTRREDFGRPSCASTPPRTLRDG
jgi:hypothetical protein